MLTIENVHESMHESVSFGDTVKREPTHICERDPAKLVRKFVEEQESHGKSIQDQVRAEFVPEDVHLLPKAQREKKLRMVQPNSCFRVQLRPLRPECDQKKHFVEQLAETSNKIKVAKNGNKTMFMHTRDFRFLDIISYLGPGTSYDKWVKAYERKAVKSWLPYEWFDIPEKQITQGFQTIQNGIRSKRGDIF